MDGFHYAQRELARLGRTERKGAPDTFDAAGFRDAGGIWSQVRIEDVVAADDIFTTLMGEDVENRRKFIEDNALEVRNLDI